MASSLELPRPEEPGEYLLELSVHPFVSEEKVPAQKLRVVINNAEVGDFDVRVTSSLECLLPWNLLKAGDTVAVEFAHPFAASRSAVNGEPDERLIALAFQRISLRKLQDVVDAAAAPAPFVAASPAADAAEGHVDAYGYYPSAACWVFVGWSSHRWTDALDAVTARFDDRAENTATASGFYDLPGLRGRGRGFVLAIDAKPRKHQLSKSRLLALQVATARFTLTIDGHGRTPLGVEQLDRVLRPIFASAVAESDFGAVLARLPAELAAGLPLPRPASHRERTADASAMPAAFEGHIDFCGYHAAVGGWLFCGWVTAAWPEDGAPIVIAQFVDGDVSGRPAATFYHRDEIGDRGVGVVFLLPADPGDRERLLSVAIEFPTFTTTIPATQGGAYGENALLAALRPILLHRELRPDRAGLRSRLFGASAAASPAAAAVVPPVRFGGHVDFYGYHPPAQAWFFCGWVSKSWNDADKPRLATARFERGTAGGETTLATFYYRDDLEGRGVGFVLALPSPDSDRNHLVSLDLTFADGTVALHTTAAGPNLPPRELVEWLTPLLTGGEANSNRSRLQAMLLPAAADAGRHGTQQGFVDFYGYHPIAGGWLFCGWVSREAEDATGKPTVTAQFERGDVRGEAASIHYAREDLGDRGLGIVLFMSGPGSPLGGLSSVTVDAADLSFRIYPGLATRRLREQELLSSLRGIVAGAIPGVRRDVMLAILGREGFTGADTIGQLSDRIFLELDEAIFCEPDGMVLIGWHLAKPGAVRHIRLRCGALVSTIDLDDGLRVDRPDVLAAVGTEHGFDDPRCGFIVFLPHAVDGAGTPYIEIETRRGEVGYRLVPPPKLGGIAAIRRLLECFDVRFLDVPRAYDRVVGPAVELLNKNRLETGPNVASLEFGTPPANPAFSIIVPLYGRIDFVEYQIALFSAHPPSREFEFIYVLDDPSKRREAQFLFTSVHERFRMPFRALLLDRNVGFAPANNIGLRHARGIYVCYLNSDVFPGTPDWLERLAARLAANPELGVIGPLLLYEDGSVQHQGMSFRRLSEFGGWNFGHHPGKGMQLGNAKGMRRCISITGACMLLRRALAERVRGFDEAYAIGDFEDSDLCLRLNRMGLAAAVDLEVHLFHLERKSQARAAASWRMNLTLYNAWLHERRWARAIAAHPQALAPTPFGEGPADG
ncbi:MAG TPA: glycosyltransferase family 2 protein [Stellaceae bacterium]|nr:glycosyltransferase family 2 protein [Stellaceae bacterium]